MRGCRAVHHDVQLYGTPEPTIAAATLRHGAVDLQVTAGAGVGAVRFHGAEACRGLGFVFRDAGWATPATALLESPADGDAGVTARRLSWTSEVEGTLQITTTVELLGPAAAPRLEVTAAATALQDFATCRTGFVVLHPASLSGAPLAVTGARPEPEGVASVRVARFPRTVAAQQPFTDMTGLAHDVRGSARGVGDGEDGSVHFTYEACDGAPFEMEDQRQWLDASFKSYFRPLRRRLPYSVAKGTVRAQTAPAARRTLAARVLPAFVMDHTHAALTAVTCRGVCMLRMRSCCTGPTRAHRSSGRK